MQARRREIEVGRREQRHVAVRRRGVVRPDLQDLEQVAADPGRAWGQLAGVDRDPHARARPPRPRPRAAGRQRLVDFAQRRRRGRPVEDQRSAGAAGAQRRRQPAVRDHALHGRGQLLRIVRGHEEPGVAQHFGQGAAIRRDDRNADRHRFEDRQAEALEERREDQRGGAGVERRPLLIRDVAAVLDASGEGIVVELRQHRRRFGDRPPDQHQRRGLRVARHQPAVGVEEAGDVLPRLERPDEEEIAEGRGRRGHPDRPGRPPWPAYGDSAPGKAEPGFDFARRVGRDGDDVVGLVRVAAGLRRIASGELGEGSLGMLEEVEVVDGRQPYSRPRRHERRQRRLDDVPWAAGQPFHRWPGPPLPERPQQPRWQPDVGDGGAGNRGGPEPVLPRAGEDGDRVASGRYPDQRLGQPVDVLADACPGHQRRPVVEQDAHDRREVSTAGGPGPCPGGAGPGVCKPLLVSGLTSSARRWYREPFGAGPGRSRLEHAPRS